MPRKGGLVHIAVERDEAESLLLKLRRNGIGKRTDDPVGQRIRSHRRLFVLEARVAEHPLCIVRQSHLHLLLGEPGKGIDQVSTLTT